MGWTLHPNQVFVFSISASFRNDVWQKANFGPLSVISAIRASKMTVSLQENIIKLLSHADAKSHKYEPTLGLRALAFGQALHKTDRRHLQSAALARGPRFDPHLISSMLRAS